MTPEEIKEVLEKHEKWLNDEEGGVRADLQGADLQGADLQGADLQGADLQGADLRGAYLQGADLRGADLRGADLRWADLDFSCLPLWCGGAGFKCDPKLVYQLLAHICTLDFPDEDGIKELILPFAKRSHRAEDLGLLDDSDEA